MFRLELLHSHDKYRTIVSTIGYSLSHNNPKYSSASYDKKHQKLLNLNLDPLLEYIPSFCSEGVRPTEH